MGGGGGGIKRCILFLPKILFIPARVGNHNVFHLTLRGMQDGSLWVGVKPSITRQTNFAPLTNFCTTSESSLTPLSLPSCLSVVWMVWMSGVEVDRCGLSLLSPSSSSSSGSTLSTSVVCERRIVLPGQINYKYIVCFQVDTYKVSLRLEETSLLKWRDMPKPHTKTLLALLVFDRLKKALHAQ